MNTPKPQPAVPSRRGFNDADHILRRAIPYYWPEAYSNDPGLRLGSVELIEGHSFGLFYPQEFACRPLRISFTGIKGRSDVVWVRSTNWRCEHEPSGAMKIAHARDLWRACIAAGMQPF
jgi:hypothetical protein